MNLKNTALLLTLAMAAGVASANPTSSLVTFESRDGGAQGWTGMQTNSGIGGTLIDQDFGADAPAIRTKMEFPFIAWWNNTNPAYLGDWGQLGSVTISLDVFTTYIDWLGKSVTRPLVVEFRDYDNPTYGPWTSVWYTLGTLDASKGWQSLSVTIADTTSTELPAGWGGTGNYEGNGLPAGRTFANVLASVDVMLFHTSPPGYYYAFTHFDVALDNIKVTAVPEPSGYAMLLSGVALLGWMTRRKSRASFAS
jgi:hypothetical protein